MSFAFPNVKESKGEFIGCGRYAAFSNGPQDGYSQPMSQIVARTEIKEAASRLAPPPPDVAEKQVYEKKDRNRIYAGNSLQLAYLLACVGCYRSLKFQEDGDLWCTGRIHTRGPEAQFYPLLGDAVFGVKLEAFCTDDSQDRVFLVPFENMTQSHRQLCQGHHIECLLLAEWITRRQTGADTQKIVVMVKPNELYRLFSQIFQVGPNPYRGLTSFQEEDAVWFFGREQISQQIGERCAAFSHTSAADDPPELRFLAILGPSGTGKSSLLRAGFAARNVRSKQGSLSEPLTIVCTPGHEPFHHLAQGVMEKLPQAADECHDPAALAETMKSQGISDVIGSCTSRPVFLVIDQFEELYNAPSPQNTPSSPDYHQYLDHLLAAASDERRQIAVLIILRTDFLNHTKRHPALDQAIAHNNMVIPGIQRTQLRQVIEEPAKRAGAPLDAETVDLLLVQTEDHEGTLPLLEFALTRIWEGIEEGLPPRATLDKIDGVGGALAHRADDIYESLTLSEQRIARRAFLSMVAGGDAAQGFSIRQIKVLDLVAAQETFDLVHQVLLHFSQHNARLITLTTNAQGQAVTALTHAALCRYWTRFRKWLETSEVDRQFKEQVKQAAADWQQHNRSHHVTWRGPKLANLHEYYHQHHDLTACELAFYKASKFWQRLWTGTKWGAIVLLILLALFSGMAWVRNTLALNHLEQQRNDIIRNLTVSADRLLDLHRDLDAVVSITKAVTSVRNAEADHARFADWMRVPSISEIHTVLTAESPFALEESVHDNAVQTFRKVALSVRERNRLHHHQVPGMLVRTIGFSADGSLFASGGSDGVIRIWRTRDGAELHKLRFKTRVTPLGLVFHPQTTILAAGYSDGTVHLWDAQAGQHLNTLSWQHGAVKSVDFNRSGNILAAGGEDGTLMLWDVGQGQELNSWQGHDGNVYRVRFHPADDTLLASAGQDGIITTWKTQTGEAVKQFQGHKGFVYSLAFSPDGNLLATAGQDHKILLWNLTQDNPISDPLEGHTEVVYDLSFAPDGQTLASAGQDRTVRLWNVEDGRSRVVQGHTDAVFQVTFHPAGTLLASSGKDQVIKFWEPGLDIPSYAPLDELFVWSCERIQGYLHTNPYIRAEDRDLCDGVLRIQK